LGKYKLGLFTTTSTNIPKSSSHATLYHSAKPFFSTQSSNSQTLFSDLISLANTSWNQEPYNTIFAPLLYAIQTLQNNQSQYRQKGALLSYNLYVGLEQPIANAAKRTVLPGGGRKQVSLSRRVLPRGP